MMLVFTSEADALAAEQAISTSINFPMPVNAGTLEEETHVGRTTRWARPMQRFDDNALWFFPKPNDPHTAAVPLGIQFTEEAFDLSWEPPPPTDDP